MSQTLAGWAVLFVAAVRLSASSTSVLGGLVTDDAGAPLAGATVTVEEPPLETVTDVDGRFRFADLAGGTYRLRARAEGYFESPTAEIELTEEAHAFIELRLRRKEPLVQAIVVTGTRTPHRLTEAPVRTDVVPGFVCERRALRTLAEALTGTASGVRVESTCQNCGFLSVRLNGLQGQYTQILEDGLPAVSGLSMVYALDQIPTDYLDAIEVVKGGASALYGPSAVGGVINLIRREPRGRSFTADIQSGWQRGRPESSFGGLAQAERLPGGFSADAWIRTLRRTQVDRDGDGFSDVPRKQTHSGGGTLFRRFDEGRARLSAGVNLMDDFRRGGDGFDRPPEQTQITEMAASRRYAGTLRWNQTVTSSTVYSLASSLAYLSRTTYYGANFDPRAYGATGNPLWVSEAQVAHQLSRHTLTGGFQFQREQVRDSMPAYHRQYRELFRNTGLYMQNEFRPADRVVPVGGLRADKSNTLEGWVWSPRGNLRVALNESWTVRLGVATGFRPPVIFEEDLHVTQVGGQGLLLENAPGLREERSLSRTLAVDYVASAGGWFWQVGANLFWTSLSGVHLFQELKAPGLGSGYRRLQRVNGAGSRVRGVEFDAGCRFGARFGARGGLTVQQARYDEPEPDFGSLRYFRAPNRYGYLAADADLPGRVALTITSDFTGSMLVPHYRGFIAEDRLERTRSFTVWSAIVSRTWRPASWPGVRLRLYCRLVNLSDSFQPDLDRGPLRDSGYFYGPTAMRGAVLGLSAIF